MSWFKKGLRQDLSSTLSAREAAPVDEVPPTEITPNLRALRLVMTLSDLLISMGVSANSVVVRALDVADVYCTSPVHIDVASNLLMISQLRNLDKEPLTLIRPVTLRDVNYTTIQAVQKLTFDIHKGNATLEQAEARLDAIIKQPHNSPWWLIMIGNGLIVAGVSLMFTSSWRVIAVTFIIGLLVDRLLHALTKRAFPAFFRQIAAAAFVTLSAATVNMLAHNDITFFENMNPTLIVVGGIVMLVAGLAVVGAIQDAIDEYYLTANARIMKVILQTIGIVIGIMAGLYIARKLGIGIAVSPNPLKLNFIHLQAIGGGVAAIGYALSTQTNLRAITWIGLIGSASMLIMYSSVNWFGISIVPASGIAAAFVGVTASFMSRFWRTPSIGIIAAGIVPLVPGLMLYNGLMQLINYPPGDPLFFKALGTLFTVTTTGLSIAVGASLGSMIGRPFRQKIAADRNLAPFIDLINRQFKPTKQHPLARFVLRRSQPNNRPSDDNTSSH